MPMSLKQRNEYREMIANRNLMIAKAIECLARAMNNPMDIDATFDIYEAEENLRMARDWNTEATVIRKAGMR